MCDDYLQYNQNVDQVLRDIQDDVNKNKQNLQDYKHEFKSRSRRMKSNETAQLY